MDTPFHTKFVVETRNFEVEMKLKASQRGLTISSNQTKSVFRFFYDIN